MDTNAAYPRPGVNLEQQLAAILPPAWVTRQAIILDWNDGPRIGVCALTQPHCELFFHLFAEPIEADLLAIHLFAVSELPAGAVDRIVELLHDLGQPTGPLWVPVWNFANEAIRRDVEARLDALLVTARPTGLLAATSDWLHFDGCWNAEMTPLTARVPSALPKS